MPTTISGNDGVSQVQNNTITQSDLTTAVLPLGVGQSWVNQTSIRASNTDYTNDTGRPIFVTIQATLGGTTGYASIVVSGVGVSYISNTVASNLVANTAYAVVPAGATYRCNTNSTVNVWAELR